MQLAGKQKSEAGLVLDVLPNWAAHRRTGSAPEGAAPLRTNITSTDIHVESCLKSNAIAPGGKKCTRTHPFQTTQDGVLEWTAGTGKYIYIYMIQKFRQQWKPVRRFAEFLHLAWV